MNNWRVILATLVIFAAGVVVGGLAVKKSGAIAATTAKTAAAPGGNPGAFRLQSLLHRMDRELALTPDQHAQIEKIIATSQTHTRDLWTPVAQQMKDETQKACDQIRDVLTPDQQTKFDALSKGPPPGEFGERGERGRRRGGPGGPGGPFSNFPPRGQLTN